MDAGNWLKALAGAVVFVTVSASSLITGSESIAESSRDYQAARWDPIHFSPQIETATNEECLNCHQEILTRETLPESPAGLQTEQTIAWYQTLSTYDGGQETFHRRHLVTPMASELMSLRCNTCHQGHDPRDEAPGATAVSANDAAFTLRKQVNPEVCHMCHGQFNYQVMSMPGPWTEFRDAFGNTCMTCHNIFRTNRHNVNFLKPEAIEAAGAESGDSCYGCHGGRSWYRTSYPYPRHDWPNMPPATPSWAVDRPVESQKRFLE